MTHQTADFIRHYEIQAAVRAGGKHPPGDGESDVLPCDPLDYFKLAKELISSPGIRISSLGQEGNDRDSSMTMECATI
ncbi:MAG: hypothetical protein ACLTSZ_19755 [Lachnospiraceae bacterium]